MDKEKELAALKNRQARLLDFFATPRAIVSDGRSKQRVEELLELNKEIARLEDGPDPAISQHEVEIRKILLNEPCEIERRIDYPGQINDLEDHLKEMREELEKMANDPDVLQELMTQKNNAVEHPSHYTSGGIECIDAMKAMLSGYEQAKIVTKFYWHFLSGQILKYLWRWPLKERPLQDLKKARWYLDKLISDIETKDK